MLSTRLFSFGSGMRQSARIRALRLGAGLLTAGLMVTAWAAPSQKRAADPSHVAASGGRLTLLTGSGTLDGSYSYQTLSTVLTAPDGSALDVTDTAAITS